jgi:hypothetical protein
MRIWFSGPRILSGLVRPGVSFGPKDFRAPRLPSWKRFELGEGLQTAARARGETLTKECANYVIDRARACGLLDARGELTVNVKGDRDTCIKQAREAAAYWGSDPNAAERQAIRALAAIDLRRAAGRWLAIDAAVIVVIIFLTLAARAEDSQYGFTSPP